MVDLVDQVDPVDWAACPHRQLGPHSPRYADITFLNPTYTPVLEIGQISRSVVGI